MKHMHKARMDALYYNSIKFNTSLHFIHYYVDKICMIQVLKSLDQVKSDTT